VCLAMAGMVLGSAILVSVAPALVAARTDPNEVLRKVGKVPSRSLPALTRIFVVAEVAVSCLALISIGSLARTMVGYGELSPVLAAESTMMATVNLPADRYPHAASHTRYWDELRRLVQERTGLPVLVARGLPGWGERGSRFELGGMQDRVERVRNWTMSNAVQLDYFTTYGVRLVRGRMLSSSDRAGAEAVAVVNESFVQTFLGDEDPIGKRVRFLRGKDSWTTIVGVVTDLPVRPPDLAPDRVYRSLPQTDRSSGNIAFTTEGDIVSAQKLLQEALRDADPDLIPGRIGTMAEMLTLGGPFMEGVGLAALAGGFGALAISMVGLYGVVAFFVRQRLNELGIRLALGASSRHVARIVVVRGARELLPGLALGWLAAFFALPKVLLFLGGRAYDPLLYIGVPALFLAAGLLACLPSALQVIRLQPTEVLRAE